MSTEDVIIRCPICNEVSPQGYLLCPFCGADLTVTYEQKIFAPVTYKEVWFRIKSLIVKPRVIAQEIADNPDSKGAFLFIVAISLGLSLQVLSFVMHTRLLDMKFYPVVFLLGWIAILLLPTLIWLLGSWVIRLMTRLLGGKASRKQIRAAVGYGMMPIVFSELFIGILFLIALPWRDPDSYDFSAIFNDMSSLRHSFIGIVGLVIHFLGLAASSIYIVFIAKPACEFSWLETAIATGIPMIVYLILMIIYYIGT
ncbi:MAG: hypothetical protein GPJ52_05410 [Candidatus Heimdallarchaeota archaeon]|nr:hypothetical protein [Candidatus Heimdallarchaeota archaeon]MCG3252464.1 YIP1 family protein [Candidatus Heimdallarchaeota archaeon]MCK4289602.1 YIP1 family protein [Candidatus Heimdallarchaeota archaeon]